ncbi:MAG: Serine/threonine-protein kinase pkn3 [Myxococcaceae bacterium]|nr:Serine/threonine-protein kinase pkn3 [Myxococcaceae bacterium]
MVKPVYNETVMPRGDRSAPVRPGDVLADKYRVERILGSGGMGVVVLAKHLDLGAPVAIKFLLPEVLDDDDVVARFSREARAMFRLRSEHIARVMDVGKLPNGAPYMVMEYLDGSDLGGVLRTRKRLDVHEAVTYVMQACEAVAEAHSLGIIHRDIKPQNLFLTLKVDGTAHIKVLDFGISKMLDNSGEHEMKLTHSSAVMGSPYYMSPEQLRSSASADRPADIWALGVVLYELLTGRVPFMAESAPALYAMLLVDKPRSPRELRPDMPKELAAVILRCLERKPEDRFASIGDLASALEPFAPASMVGAGKRVAAVRARELPPKSGPISPVATTGTPESITEVKTGVSWEGTDPSRKKQRTRLVFAGFVAALAAGGLVLFVQSRLPSAAHVTPTAASTLDVPFDAGAMTASIEPLAPTFVISAPTTATTTRRPVLTKAPAPTTKITRPATPPRTTAPAGSAASGPGFDMKDWNAK